MNLIERITEYLMAWAEKRGRIFKITGTAGPEDVYLIRYYIIQTRWFNFFIHQFLRSDRDDLHDHPWDFCTYLVRGAYMERKWNQASGLVEETWRINSSYDDLLFKENTLVFRKATDQHQVVVKNDLREDQKDFAALTLCFTGPTRREWGFIKERPMTPDEYLYDEIVTHGRYRGIPKTLPTVREWVYWKKYLGLPDDAPTRG